MDGTLRCEKCSSPLTVSANDATRYGGYTEPDGQAMKGTINEIPDFGATVTEAQQFTPPPYHGDVMSTVREAAPYTEPQPDRQPEPFSEIAPTPDSPQPAIEDVIPAKCPACGYPLSDGMSECPYCNTPVSGKVAEAAPAIIPLNDAPLPQPEEMKPAGHPCPSCGAMIWGDARFCPSCGSSIAQPGAAEHHDAPHINRVTMGTVRNATVIPGFSEQPTQPPTPIHYCTLRRREWPGEMVKYTPTTYPGDSVVLNRMNTDQHNNTITSKQQAVITCEDGQWFIEDRSALQSTYVRVKGKVPIKPGDIILLGNREFEFEGF